MGLWLLDGTGRGERRRRALSLWDEDMRNRQQHETDTGHLPSSGGMTGAQRRTEMGAALLEGRAELEERCRGCSRGCHELSTLRSGRWTPPRRLP